MFNLTITANSGTELKAQLLGLLSMFKNIDFQKENGETIDTSRIDATKVCQPLITQAQMEENIKNAPEHKLPDPPSIEEVRAALKELRARKGADAVREILSAYGVENLTQLKPEDYAGALDRAKTEV
jgi:hypothetical protein